MVYYFLLVIASLLYSFQIMATSMYQRKNGKEINSAVLFSVFQGLFGIILMFFVQGFSNNFTFNFSWFSCLLAFIFAIVCIANSPIGIKTLSLGSVAIYTFFFMIGGMVVPFIYGIFFLDEAINIYKIIGLVLLFMCLSIPFLIKNKDNKKYKPSFFILCSLLFLLNGATSVISKAHQINENAVGAFEFMLYYYIFLFIFAIPTFLITNKISKKKKEEIKPLFNFKAILAAFLFVVVNGAGYILQLISCSKVVAVAIFPIITGGTIIFSSLLGALLYKEHLGKGQLLQILLALVATILFMF